MARVFFHKFPHINATYKFKCRNEGIIWTQEMVNEIRDNINALCELRFTEDEIDYIKSIYFMKDAHGFIEFLRMFKLNRRYIDVMYGANNLCISAEGPIWSVSMFEIYVLAIVNEVYFKHQMAKVDKVYQQQVMEDGGHYLRRGLIKAQNSKHRLLVSDFGTRRRFSKDWQRNVLKVLKETYENPGKDDGLNFVFTGTSNVMFAKELGLTPIGTMAHEYIQLGQALDNVTIANSQRYMMQVWADEYRGHLGTALSDTLGVDYFLKHDFDAYFAKLFDGVRHDSGCPYEFGNKMIKHYQNERIDPMTKTIIYSDGLDFDSAIELNDYFHDKIKVAFGIGTKLTNNFGNYLDPLNIVFKMVRANGKPVAKLSDVNGKCMCEDEEYLKYLRNVIAEGVK